VTTVSRLSFLGVRAAGTNIALFGGLAATIALMLSGMAGSILSVPDVSVSAPLVKAIYYLSFLCGGVLYAVGFGLLAAGMSVTTYFMRPLPRWLTILGILLAITGELCWFSPVAFPANFFIPITRYAGFIWMLLAASALTKDRRVVHAASAAVPSWTASGLRHKKQSSETTSGVRVVGGPFRLHQSNETLISRIPLMISSAHGISRQTSIAIPVRSLFLKSTRTMQTEKPTVNAETVV
jgi:hypothetical protein